MTDAAPPPEPRPATPDAGVPEPDLPPEDQGRPFDPDLPHPGDYGASEDEQRRVVGRPRDEAP